jgi:hypothetical protein
VTLDTINYIRYQVATMDENSIFGATSKLLPVQVSSIRSS